ncbi:hypothetical protein GGQ64_003384 [Rhizobium azooxidifex]|jgi:hypothetical protein|uniref:Uncharacterized protein n=1 Tax=Mycoplana azooxidifex TaxID=1636188 RepID=A0A7W6GK27_9HYPH|nr:hypothetical protein [Mycoplana azooxidifex]MBB3978170.1 hypothetical protein [Mycoplana azooxidifex]
MTRKAPFNEQFQPLLEPADNMDKAVHALEYIAYQMYKIREVLEKSGTPSS